jgi:predicted nucleotidyltransferase
MDVTRIRELVRAKFGADTRVAAVYLFGSRARGTARPESDVDLGVLYRAKPSPTLLGQPFAEQVELSAAIGKPVDLVVMNTAPADLVHRVLRDGQLLLEVDRSLRIAFEVKVRNEYFDLLPILQRYRRASA